MLIGFEFSGDDEKLLAGVHVPVPLHEPRRVETVKQICLLDTNTQDEAFDRYTRLASRKFKVSTAFISLMDVHREWIKSGVNAPFAEIHRNRSACAHMIMERTNPVVVVTDTQNDTRFASNSVLAETGTRFFAAAILMVQGMKVGTLVLMDTFSRTDFGEREAALLAGMAELVSGMMEERHARVLAEQSELMNVALAWNRRVRRSVQHLGRLCAIMRTSAATATVDPSDFERQLDGFNREILSGMAMIESYRSLSLGSSLSMSTPAALRPLAKLRSFCPELSRILSSKPMPQTFMTGLSILNRLKSASGLRGRGAEWNTCELLSSCEMRSQLPWLCIIFSAFVGWTRDPSNYEKLSVSMCIDEGLCEKQVEQDGDFVVRVTQACPSDPDSQAARDATLLPHIVCGPVLRAIGGGMTQHHRRMDNDKVSVVTLFTLPCRFKKIFVSICDDGRGMAPLITDPEVSNVWRPRFAVDDEEQMIEQRFQKRLSIVQGLTITINPLPYGKQSCDKSQIQADTALSTPRSGRQARKHQVWPSESPEEVRSPIAASPPATTVAKISTRLTNLVRSFMGLIGNAQPVSKARSMAGMSVRRKILPE